MYGSYWMAGDVDGWQSYFGESASSNTFWYARALSFRSGKLLLPQGTVSLLTGRARPPPSQMPPRSGTQLTAAGAWACISNGTSPIIVTSNRAPAVLMASSLDGRFY